MVDLMVACIHERVTDVKLLGVNGNVLGTTAGIPRWNY
jgi:hypothetical protein